MPQRIVAIPWGGLAYWLAPRVSKLGPKRSNGVFSLRVRARSRSFAAIGLEAGPITSWEKRLALSRP